MKLGPYDWIVVRRDRTLEIFHDEPGGRIWMWWPDEGGYKLGFTYPEYATPAQAWDLRWHALRLADIKRQ